MRKPYLIAIIITVLAFLWIGSGYFIPSSSSKKVDETLSIEDDQEKQAMKVQVKTLRTQNYQKMISANGRSQASKNITIRAEAQGQIIEILADEGSAVKVKENIVKIDVRERQQRVREAQELVKQRKIEYEAARKLNKQGYASDVRVAQTQSAYESARASLTLAEIDLGNTIVTAPFDGVLGERMVDVGDYVLIGDAITSLVDLTPLDIVVFVNESEVVQIQKDSKATLSFAGGQNREGIVNYIAPAADEKTRTFRVQIQMDNVENPLPAGLTAQVDITVESKNAFQIKPSIMTLGDDGRVGVKVVNGENKIEFKSITIIEDKPDYLWVSGLNDGDRVVIVGQDFVAPEQIVEAVEAK